MMKYLIIVTLLQVLSVAQSYALKVESAHNCFGQTLDQEYILSDSDDLFIPPGTFKLEQLLSDWPKATRIREDYYIVTTEAGFRAGFSFLKGYLAKVSFEPKTEDAETWDERCIFIREIQSHGWTNRYLVKNVYRSMEKEAQAQLASNKAAIIPESIDEKTYLGLEAKSDTLLLISDKHGEANYLDRFLRLASLPSTEWIGIEFIPDSLSDALKIFLTSSVSDQAFQQVDEQMLDFFSKFWLQAGKKGKLNPYYIALRKLKDLHVPIYAMDPDEFYSVNSHYESQITEGFYYMSRNANWASRLPVRGHGIVFGGSEHFTLKNNGQFQDFYALKSSSRIFQIK